MEITSAARPHGRVFRFSYGAMFSTHIGQADEGCDFDFLAGKGQIAEPEIH